jgi:hypothetical protein
MNQETFPDFALLRRRMAATGIGLAGLEGAWWLPAIEPFTLPAAVAGELAQIGAAIFALFDAVTGLYGTPAGEKSGLDALLNYKVPAHIPRLMSRGRVESVRPDFQLKVVTDSTTGAVSSSDISPHASRLTLHLAATELEICPSAHGFAHAMQVGYNLPTDVVESFARYLRGRELLFVGSSQWSEFLLEQLAFCRALAEVGAAGRVLYDIPIARLADEIQQGRRWQPPMFGIKAKPPGWNDDLRGRIRAHGLESFLWPDDTRWPESVGNSVVFRFGYFDCFTPDKLNYFLRWQAQGATLLNPAMFILDSKAIMAALNLPIVQERIAALNPAAGPVLTRCLPETLLLQPDTLPRLMAEQTAWLVKYAGFDGGNQSWGGRSLQVGCQHPADEWRKILEQAVALPWPVVAQRLTPSVQVDIGYRNAKGKAQVMRQGVTRLRTFFLRDESDVLACGSHLTVSGGTMQVSEATDSVQAPVIFRD